MSGRDLFHELYCELIVHNRQLSPHELAHQEALIAERETEIRNIETGIPELNEIFGQLGTIVHEQGNIVGMYLLPSLRITILDLNVRQIILSQT